MTGERTPDRPEPRDFIVDFSPRQIGGFVLIAAIVLALGRWLRRPRGKV